MITKQQQVDFLIAHIVDNMAQYLIDDFGLDLISALQVIYNAKIYELLQDEKNELYVQSPSYIYELLKKEYLTATYLP